jgi:hypothetical protein
VTLLMWNDPFPVDNQPEGDHPTRQLRLYGK